MKLVNGYYFPDTDVQCSGAVFNEVHKISKIVKHCKKLNTVVQAGGNVGLFPVELSKIFTNVITFEPDNDNYACLLKNIKDYDNIEHYKKGLGDGGQSRGTIYQPATLDNCGSLAIKEDKDGEVKITTIDSLNLQDLDLIYLDIEGAEFQAINGARTTIDICKPVIALENKGLIPGFTDGGFNGSKKLRNWVCSLGYEYKGRLMRDDIFIPV